MDKFVVRYNVVENEAVDAIEKSGVFGLTSYVYLSCSSFHRPRSFAEGEVATQAEGYSVEYLVHGRQEEVRPVVC